MGHNTAMKLRRAHPPIIPVVGVVVLLAYIVLPYASPFGVGTHAGTTSIPPTAQRLQPASSAASSPKSIRSSGGVLRMLPTDKAQNTDREQQFAGQLTGRGKEKGDGLESTSRGEYNATIPSRLTYSYVSPLLHAASKRQLEASDAFPVPDSRKMGSAVPYLERIYDKCRARARRRLEEKEVNEEVAREKLQKSEPLVLAKSLLLHQRKTLILTGILRFCNTAIQAFPAILVSRLLRLVESGDTHHPAKALRAAVTLVAVLSLKMIVENLYFHNVVKCATQVRGSLAGMIFDKSLRVAGGGGTTPSSDDGEKAGKKSGGSLGSGGVLNLMQSDASILEATTQQLHTIWDGPLQISIYATLLFNYLGRSVLWGMGVLLLTIPMNSVFLRVLNRLTKRENEAKDARTKRTAEAISNMKILKLQAWENNFAEDVQRHRRNELQRHITRGAVRALNSAISNAVPALVLVVTLTAYTKTGKPVVASTIFTAISLFNQLRFPLFFYPMLIDSLANGKNALKRISSYLSSEEITPYVQHLPAVAGDGGSIEMRNGNFLWSASNSTSQNGVVRTGAPALYGGELSVKPGEVVAVIGPVGSGKTSLIKGLLGELAPVPSRFVDPSSDPLLVDVPTVVARGSVAYCAQEAWLPKGTIREAVVFGREYNEERYLAAVHDAGLDADIVDEVDDVTSKAAASRGMLTHETDVGEGGSSLSGGQRARVALARALYAADAGVFLLDDPLSALDASVGSMVFERLMARVKRANAATVFVTNDPSLPRRCDRVVLMGKFDQSSSPSCSQIVDVGTYDELIARGHDLRSITAEEDDIDTEHEEIFEEDGNDEAIPFEVGGHSGIANGKTGLITSSTTPNVIRVVGGYHSSTNDTIRTCHADPDCQAFMERDPNSIAEKKLPLSPDIHDDVDKIVVTATELGNTADTRDTDWDDKRKVEQSAAVSSKKPPKTKLVSADDAMTTGAVPRATYVTYLRSVRKPLLIVAMLLSYLTANGAQFFQQYVVAKWTEIGSGDAMAVALGGRYLKSLVRAAGVVSVFLWLRSYLTMRVGVKASEFLHNRMLSSVFGAPISFFDATPSGQLLSRFGKEMETVDRALPDGIGSVLFCFLQLFMSGIALASVVTPGMVLPLGVIGILYARAMSRFRPAARDLKRSESKSRSPIYTHFGEALRGVETIRSIPSGRATWSSHHRHLTDNNLSVFYSVKALDRWLSVRLESLGNVVVFTAAVASVFLTRVGRLKAGSAGWGLTQALSITGLLTWAVRVLTDLETQMMSVLRITEVTDLDSTQTEGNVASSRDGKGLGAKMPREHAETGEALEMLLPNSSSIRVPSTPNQDLSLVESGWPWKGGIEFNNVSMRYNQISPLVLKNVTVTVPPGTTLGVVGRTGSGKSSLLLTLFRLVEIEGVGNIKIDGVDIRSVSLQTLRQSLSIIPQDPVLFAGTIMYNLDATGKASREDAWKALESASPDLARQFRSAGTGLDTEVSEGGKNLSLGQRQLICLARALLRKSKVLVLDEATSSVDPKTDAQVQDTIRREFVKKGVTVVTVAHRLDTVLGYDRIAVLGGGELIEYGAPSELVRIPGGELRRLVNADKNNKRKGARTNDSYLVVG